jgi:hypothetical protein
MSRSATQDVCIILGAQWANSALESLQNLAKELHVDTRIAALLPCEMSCLLPLGVQAYVYTSGGELKSLILRLEPRCIVLISHDPKFGILRRDPRTLRWMHEIQRCYDPQANRCHTPIFATSLTVARHLPGFAGEARPHRDWSIFNGLSCHYTAGPLRILGVGDISNPRSNFKAFQFVAEKYSAQQFIWVGSTTLKQWQNILLLTANEPLEVLMQSCDIMLWCAEDDPCPMVALQALYLGVRVMLFQKSLRFTLPGLYSQLDGSALLDICECAPQHAAIHTTAKNPKNAQDVQRAREYVLFHASRPPALLLTAIRALL